MLRIVFTGWVTLLLLFSACSQFNQDQENPLKYIPEDAPVILTTNNLLSLWNTYAQSSVWSIRDENPDFQKVYREMMELQLLADQNPGIEKTFTSGKITLAVSVSNKYKASLLMAAQTSLTTDQIEQMIRAEFSNLASVTQESYLEKPYYSIVFSERDVVLYYAVRNGVLLLSYDASAIERAFQQYAMKRSILDEPGFKEVSKTAGQFSEGNVYLNFKKMHRLLLSGTYSQYGNLIGQLESFAGWASLDLTARKDKLILNGFTQCDSTNYLNSFKHNPGSIDLQNIIPSSASIALLQNYHSEAIHYKRLKKDSAFAVADSKFNLLDNFFSWYSGTNALVLDNSRLNNLSDKSAAIFLAEDSDQVYQGLEAIASETGDDFYDKTGDDGKRIIRIPSETLIEDAFGKMFMHFQSPYFTVHENLVIASASLTHLTETLRKLENEDVIAHDDTYQSLSAGISENSNMVLYLNMKHALQQGKDMNPGLKETIERNKTAFDQFSGLTATFSRDGDLFFTNLYSSAGEALQAKKEKSWELKLDAKVVGEPQIVNDHLSAEKRIIAFDALNNMYFISHDGKILWKHTLSGRPLGKVHLVDAFSNNKVQYLLNTENHIYLIDVLGRDVGDFPIKLPAKATNGVSVFDYHDYRIVIAGNDRKIYNYDIEGNPVKGWTKANAPGKITVPLQHHVYNGRDYIFAQTENGKVLILNRRGNTRVNVQDQLVSAPQSQIYVNRTNSKAPFITTEISGAIKYLKLNGSILETLFDRFSNDHYFFYERFNDDRHYDFIYFDKGKLVVYDRFKNIILENQFDEEVFTTPEVIRYNQTTAIKFTSLSKEQCYLVTQEGLAEEVTGLKATTSFDIGKLKQYGKTTVIAGDGEKLVKYIL